jgi:hypothetical protein
VIDVKAIVANSLLLCFWCASALAYKFGDVPLSDVEYAAQNYNLCPGPDLPTSKLIAYMLAPTWWEVSYKSTNRTPSPMALSRGDYSAKLFPQGQANIGDPYHRVFWHPGIGAWQLDDSGMGSDLSFEKFNTQDAARKAAETISSLYCNDPSARNVFSRWYGCGSDGSICQETADEIYNSNPPIDRDNDTSRNGGAEIRACRWSEGDTAFVCVYIDPDRAEGFTGKEDGNPPGWISYPNAQIPLAKPFYVFKQPSDANGGPYEWRYWMNEDTGYGINHSAKRKYGVWSKTELTWSTAYALCDITKSRGICPPTIVPSPTNLAQLNDSGASVATGGSIGPGTLTFQGVVGGPSNKAVLLEIEVRKINELFNGSGQYSSFLFDPGATPRICVSGLEIGQYHWRARTRDQYGLDSPWVSFGGNSESSPDFIVTSNACVPCGLALTANSSVSQVVGPACGTSLTANLSAAPQSGTFPLNDVDLTASVGGASGSLDYYFYCDRADAGTDIRSDWAARFLGVTDNPKTAPDLCDYSTPRAYTAKVIAQNGTRIAEARTTVTVTGSSPQPPSVTTSSASNITQESAILNLSVTPNGSSTTVWFDYGTSSTNLSSSTSHQAVASSTETTLVNMTVAGLSCDTTYYFRARAENSEGWATGSILSFRANVCTGTEEPVQLLSNTSFEQGNNAWWVASPAFYINGGLPNYPHPHTGTFYAFLSTSQWVAGNSLDGAMISPLITIPANAASAELRYWHSVTSNETSSAANDTLGVYLVKPGNQLVGIDAISNSYKTDDPDHYTERVISISPSLFGIPVNVYFSGHTNATLPTLFRIDDVTLTAMIPIGGAPTATTQPADQITSSSARLKMTLNPNGISTTAWFNLAANDSTPDGETDHLSIDAGSGSQSVNFTVFDLQCATTYYFRARAQNANGSNQGSVLSFTTASCPGGFPVANTNPATNITRTSVTFNAQVNPNGHSTEAWFLWGRTTDFGGETAHVDMGGGTGFVDFTRAVGGLTCNTTYYFQARAANSAGQNNGATLSFTTEPCVTTLPVVAVTALDDSAREAGLESGTFRVSRTGSMANSLPIAYAMTGTATNGIDYESLGTDAIIPAGSPSVDLTVQPIQDDAVEPDETVILTIAGLDSYVVGTPTSAMVTVRSDDGEGDCYVGMLSPVGGETWVKGLPQTVIWSASPGCVEFSVSVSHGDPAEELSMGSYIAGSSFTFILPAWLVPGSYQVKVRGFDSDGLATPRSTATSNVFSVVNHTTLPSIIFEDTVEADAPLNWSSYGWGITGSTEFSHSPTHSHANIPAFYGSDVSSYLLSPKLDLSGRRSLLLTFWQRFASANFESVQVRVKDAGGNFWYVRGFTDWHAEWRPVTIDLSAFIGESSIQISFESHTPNASAAGSWYVDDIKVYEPGPTDFYTITPCRVVDTRQDSNPLSSGALSRSFLVAGTCGIPPTAKAVYFNATVVNPTAGGYVRLFPADQLVPSTSTVNFQLGQTRASNTIMRLSAEGRVGAVASLGSGQTDLVLDVAGYFAPTHPMLGLWRGLLSGILVELTVEENGGVLTAWFNRVGHPRDQLAILSLSEAQIVADRPADGDAQVRLSRVVSEIEECLVGEYFETGAGRSLTLCRVP